MAQDYFGAHMSAMDRGYYQTLDSFGTVYHPTALHEDHDGAKTSLQPRELGTSANPMQQQLIALQTKIREGASSIEFQFGGRGKGNSQASTPESYGYEDREAMRTLAEYNDVRTSTHATYTVSGLAGFDQRSGFSKEAQHQVMEEVRRAVDFAAQASTGGAVVVHSGEWHRPISEQPWAREDFGNLFGKDEPNIRGYADESKRAQLIVVDGRTGEAITGIRKDQEIYEPKWVTAADFEKYSGKKLPYRDLKGNKIEQYRPYDYVDVDGRRIDPDNTEELFRRLPEWNEEATNFATQKLTWEDLVKRTQQYNEDHKSKAGFMPVSPEQLYAQLQLENQVLQARGSSLFHGRHYENEKKRRDGLKRALELANTMYKDLPENQLWRALKTSHDHVLAQYPDLIAPETQDVRKKLQEDIDDLERSMRYIHEASSAADVQAATLEARKRNIKTMEEYGLEQTGRALADLGIYAMEKSKQMKEHVRKQGGDLHKYKDLYIAPENVFPSEYGSHPDELMRIVEVGREQMAKELQDKYNKSASEARKMAAEHIKSTVDIGHLNMWKTHMKRLPGESEQAFNNRFEKWAMDKLEVMHKKGVLGHFHITDNLGFNDEHLTPGQGNAPIRSFVKKLESLGYKDFIVEPGSFNGTTAMGETWSYLGLQGFSPHNGSFRPGGRFTEFHWRHAGGYAPPNYIVGQYVPSNEWTLWSGTPLE